MITPYSNIISVTTLPIPLLLDTYSGAAAAYSLRKLRNAYTGSAIRVRRSSDNTEQDIGFVSGELDTSTLTTFCSGTNGFVTTWYDQSGNANDATQATAANQPQIVSSGSVILQNNKPILKFSTSNELNLTSLINLNSVDSSFFMTYKKSSTGNNVVFVASGVSFLWLNYGSNQYYGQTVISDADFNTSSYMLVGATMDYGVKLNWYKNNNIEQSKLSGFSSGQEVSQIFGFQFARIESFTNEIIIYPFDQDSSASAIQTNMNNYYSIY